MAIINTTTRCNQHRTRTPITTPSQSPYSIQPATFNAITFTEEFGAAFFPGAPEAWATGPTLAPFPELAPAPPPGAGLPHPALIPHHHPAALAQMPIRVSITFVHNQLVVQTYKGAVSSSSFNA